MKKLLCMILCLLMFAALFAGCSKENTATETPTQVTSPELTEVTGATEAEVSGIHYCGLNTMSISAETLAAAVGVDASAVIATETGAGEELLIVNNVLYNGINYPQLQCINYADKSVITLTYTLNGNTLEEAYSSISDTISNVFGEASVSESSSGGSTYTWRDSTVNNNYIIVYSISETELKVSFYLF